MFFYIQRKSITSWRFLISGDENERISLLEKRKSDRGTINRTGSITAGSLKGNLVAIKRIQKKNIDVNRALKKQLQLRKELNHDNINRFIGACVDAPHIYIVTNYASRGSLSVRVLNLMLHFIC